MRRNGLNGARCQNWAKAKAHIRAAQIFQHDKAQRKGKPLSAKFRLAINGAPAALNIGFIGLFKARRHRHRAI